MNNKQSKCQTRLAGFTLIEVVVVVLVVAVLMTLALPAYQQQLLRMRRGLAVIELNALQLRQEQFFVEYRRYATGFAELGRPQGGYAIDGNGMRVAADAGAGVYRFVLAADALSFTVHAAPQSTQRADRACGRLSLSHMGARTISGTGTAVQCW